MNLEGIISVTGKGGLHKVIAKSKGGLVVESLIDAKRTPIFGANQVSALDDVSVYAIDDENIALTSILTKIFEVEAGKKCSVSPKDSSDKLTAYFTKVAPKYDTERVYTSHIKKIIGWYNLLLEKGLITIEKEVKGEKAKNKTTTKKDETKKVVAKPKGVKATKTAAVAPKRMQSQKNK